jgi:glycosyltransferase involved in cell wall biosynthesis
VVVARSRTWEGAVWASAAQPPYSGVGVFQRQVYSGLAAHGVRVVVASAEPSNRLLRALRSFARVVRPPYAAALLCVTPSPLVLQVPVVVFIFDLRYRRISGFGHGLYTYLNLRRTVARADHIFVSSRRTADELVTLFPRAAEKCTVLHLGPGIVSREDFAEGEAGTVLLIGTANHKRNELVAEALARARPGWAQHFLCVGVTDAAFQTLVDAFGRASCERFDAVDDELMRTIFRRARVYMTASMEEGFGLPMVEALTAGCQVVAIRQPLTVEIMGDAAVLLDDGPAAVIARQLQHTAWVARDIRLARSSMFSWDHVAEAVATVLHGLAPREKGLP